MTEAVPLSNLTDKIPPPKNNLTYCHIYKKQKYFTLKFPLFSFKNKQDQIYVEMIAGKRRE